MSNTAEIATYKRLFDNKYEQLAELLADLSAPALIWKPFEQSPWMGPAGSLGWLIGHGISATVYLLHRAEWIAGKRAWETVDGDEGRDPFGPANHQPAYLQARLERSQAIVNEILAVLTEADLDHSRPFPPKPERILTVRYDIQHAIEHLSQHIGHAQLTRQLWALQQADSV